MPRSKKQVPADVYNSGQLSRNKHDDARFQRNLYTSQHSVKAEDYYEIARLQQLSLDLIRTNIRHILC